MSLGRRGEAGAPRPLPPLPRPLFPLGFLLLLDLSGILYKYQLLCLEEA